jgi:acyl dehydratase
MLHFHDFPLGHSGTLPSKLVTRNEVIAFATEFDPQPMHLDEAAAAASLLGGIAASGWHTCAMLMRMMCDGFLLDTASMGSPGLKEVRWLKPVLPGDTLQATWIVTEARVSASDPKRGILTLFYEVTRQSDGASVMTGEYVHFVGVGEEDVSRQSSVVSGQSAKVEGAKA